MVMLDGKNIIALDCETLRSADDCRHCNVPLSQHYDDGACSPWTGEKPSPHITQYAPIGWENYAALGLSIGCLFSYRTMHYYFFDQHTLVRTMQHLLTAQPLIVSWNGRGFDGPLMFACAGDVVAAWAPDWAYLWEQSYDLLWEIWQVAPDDKFKSGLNSLGAVSMANGFGSKEMDGAMAPRLWAQARHAEVVNYNLGDVLKTRRLFERVVETGEIVRGDGLPIRLPRPEIGSI